MLTITEVTLGNLLACVHTLHTTLTSLSSACLCKHSTRLFNNSLIETETLMEFLLTIPELSNGKWVVQGSSCCTALSTAVSTEMSSSGLTSETTTENTSPTEEFRSSGETETGIGGSEETVTSAITTSLEQSGDSQETFASEQTGMTEQTGRTEQTDRTVKTGTTEKTSATEETGVTVETGIKTCSEEYVDLELCSCHGSRIVLDQSESTVSDTMSFEIIGTSEETGEEGDSVGEHDVGDTQKEEEKDNFTVVDNECVEKNEGFDEGEAITPRPSCEENYEESYEEEHLDAIKKTTSPTFVDEEKLLGEESKMMYKLHENLDNLDKRISTLFLDLSGRLSEVGEMGNMSSVSTTTSLSSADSSINLVDFYYQSNPAVVRSPSATESLSQEGETVELDLETVESTDETVESTDETVESTEETVESTEETVKSAPESVETVVTNDTGEIHEQLQFLSREVEGLMNRVLDKKKDIDNRKRKYDQRINDINNGRNLTASNVMIDVVSSSETIATESEELLDIYYKNASVASEDSDTETVTDEQIGRLEEELAIISTSLDNIFSLNGKKSHYR